MSFMPLKSILPLTAIGRASNIHKLSPVYLHIFLMAFTLCYKGRHYKKMIYISHDGIIYQLKKIYNIDVSTDQVKRAMHKFISLGLLERKTAIYVTPHKGKLYPVKKSYYRLAS